MSFTSLPVTGRIGLVIAIGVTLTACKKTPAATTAKIVVNPASPRIDATTGKSLAPYAVPRMGSGGYAYAAGNATPAASVPNGMARVAPETTGPYSESTFLHFDGYWAGDNVITAFSHMHLHGTGAQDYGVLGVMPTTAFVPTNLRVESYQQGFTNGGDIATPGYYGVTMNNGIKFEATATTHAAHEVYTFPADASSGTVIVDLNHRVANDNETSVDPTCDLALMNDSQTITGDLQTHNGMSSGFKLYFVMKFNTPWTASHVWQGGALQPGATTATGTEVGAAFDFPVSAGQTVQAQVGLSLVSAQGAADNLASELTSWDFDTNHAAAVDAWNQRLNTLTVYATPGQEALVTTFYSALHHVFVMPGVYSDQNGAFIYSGQTSTASGYQFVTDVSGWDIYRTLAGLYDLIAPDMALNLVQSLHSMAVMGQNYAKWPLATGDAGSMIGSAADVIVAQAYLNGITGFDVQDAYKRLRDAALLADLPAGEGRGGRDDFSDYSVLDYAVTGGAVSLTCELNQDDFALSQFATALGETADAQALAARSHGYQKLYDPTTGFLRARDAQGNIVSDNFDAGNFGLAPEYVEADAWQTMFCPQFDVDGLAQVWGGRAQLVAGLSSLFDATEKEHTADLAQQANPMGLDPNLLNINLPPVYFFGGNEPDIHYPYLFAQAGRPDLTQKWVPWVMSQYYSSAPNGLPGNDDGGTMSAWFVWSAIGLYPIPGSGKYIVGTPAFQEIDMALTGGTFKIVAQNASSTNIYVQSAKLNGVALNSAIIQWSDLKPGGALELVMGPKASQWARAD